MSDRWVIGLYDLVGFAAALPAEADFNRIKGIIRQLNSAGSALADLNVVKAHVETALKLQQGLPMGEIMPNQSDRWNATSGLMNWAIILYSRATHTSSDHRTTDPIVGKLEGDDRRWHGILTALRDDGLAHYGYGPNAAEPWSKDGLVLKLAGPAPDNITVSHIHYPPVRVQFRAQVNEALQRLAPKAYDIIRALLLKREKLFWNEFNRLNDRYDWFNAKLGEHPFDAASFWGEVDHKQQLHHMLWGTYGTGLSHEFHNPARSVFPKPGE